MLALSSKFRKLFGLLCSFVLLSLLVVGVSEDTTAAGPLFASPSFERLWARTDRLIVNGVVKRAWIWGPGPTTPALLEDYFEAPDRQRFVQYFDKGRMEITVPGADRWSPYYVSSGQLAKELIMGQIQVGDDLYTTLPIPATIRVAGDKDNNLSPTYNEFATLAYVPAPDLTGKYVTTEIDAEGVVTSNPASLGVKFGVTYGHYEPITKQNIAAPFWHFLNQQGKILDSYGRVTSGRLFDPVYYITGLPITPAYWSKAVVAGQVRDVLIQIFERRVLTFTVGNPTENLVEMGNIGLHYYNWRYDINNGEVIHYAPAVPPDAAPAVACLPVVYSGTFVQRCLSSLAPTLSSNETVYGRLIVEGMPISGALMITNWHFKGFNAVCTATSGIDGVATCTQYIDKGPPGYPVVVDITFVYGSRTFTSSTTFTPVPH